MMLIRKAVTAFVVLGVVCACAGTALAQPVISEDVAYWYRLNGGTGTIFNPSSSWLAANASALQIKVQQTVYDQEYTETLLAANGLPAVPGGYLYAYTMTNIGWTESVPFGGAYGVAIDWGLEPLLVAVDVSAAAAGWAGTPPYSKAEGGLVDGPVWIQQPGGQNLTPGSSVGGLWAVSQYGQDTYITAGVAAGYDDPDCVMIWGGTTGPIVPEPSSLAALASGLLAAAPLVRRRSR